MTLNELDKVIDKHKYDLSYESFKIEILELFVRKMNEVVPVKTHSAKTSADKVYQTGVHNTIDEMHKNIEKVMENKVQQKDEQKEIVLQYEEILNESKPSTLVEEVLTEIHRENSCKINTKNDENWSILLNQIVGAESLSKLGKKRIV